MPQKVAAQMVTMAVARSLLTHQPQQATKLTDACDSPFKTKPVRMPPIDSVITVVCKLTVRKFVHKKHIK
jgi:hypothetical protein